MSVKIEKNVPVPEKAASTSQYPFSQMEVGDSFYAEKKPSTVYGSSNSFKKGKKEYYEWEFSSRKEGTGSRTWRLK